MMLNGDFDPADNFLSDAGYKGGLILGTRWQGLHPEVDLRRGAPIPELFSKYGYFDCIAQLNRANEEFRHPRYVWSVHGAMFSRDEDR